jgi:hypothetical protein
MTVLDPPSEHKFITYLPNYYPTHHFRYNGLPHDKNTFDVGCFGAIRVLKNQLIQAIAAVDAAHRLGKKLRFFVNAHRIENKSEPVIKNIRELFEKTKHTELVECAWRPHHEFLDLVRNMDVGLQVSFNESFNIVTADFVSQGVPVVGSAEIPWLSDKSIAPTTDRKLITQKILEVFKHNPSYENQVRLKEYSHHAKNIWLDYLT